ncbi:MAG TPA: CCA tRNA nucleotidyltransferase [Dehalococcoidia bacterium]|nr:CCA tRNA nucleotidyltransferase [Dehalococcoidia bacterium]
MIAESKKRSAIPIKPGMLPLLTGINDFLTEHGIQSYIVGGFIRNALLDRDTADIDIAISTDAPKIASVLAAALDGRHIILDDVNRVSRVIIKNTTREKVLWQIDLSAITEGIEQDLGRRDFTIDAMASPLGSIINKGIVDTGLIDPFSGLDDIRHRVIRAIEDDVFQSDALRLLRGVRLAAELGFTIDPNTETLMRQHSCLINSVAGERVREELLKLLASTESGRFIIYLDDLGLLMTMIPELAQTRGVEQPREHQWDVFNHSVKAVDAVDFVLRHGNWEYSDKGILDCVPWSADIEKHFNGKVGGGGSTRRPLLKLAALLHDIAKPQTKAIDDQGKTRFFGHAEKGAAIATDILERLRFSTRETNLVAGVVRYHLRPIQTCQNEPPSRRAIYRYFRDTTEAAIDTLYFSLADHLATRGPNLDINNWHQHAALVEYIITQHENHADITAPPKIISGHDIMNTFNLTQGQKIGELLEAVREAQASAEIATREEAILYVKKLLGSKKPGSGGNNSDGL